MSEVNGNFTVEQGNFRTASACYNGGSVGEKEERVGHCPHASMNRLSVLLLVTLLAVCAAVFPALAYLQSTGVTAVATVQANIRAIPDVAGDLVGQTTAGIRYNILGRAELVPWYLLADPTTGDPLGWVFAELLVVQGDAAGLPVSTVEIGATGFTPETTGTPGAPQDGAQATQSAPPTPTLVAAVTGTVLGEINVRYGPGTTYPRIGVAFAGEQFRILTTHTQLPWVEVEYAAAPEGRAWVAVDLIEVQGDLSTLPSTSATQFNQPTLTPTPSVVQPAAGLLATPAPLSPRFRALGEQVWRLMLDAKFDPATSRMGSAFLMDLQTGEAFTFGNDIAFSGMSLTKIIIMTRWYLDREMPANNDEAVTIAEAMICSENISTNELLADIGGGNPFNGAIEVTNFLQDLGIAQTFLTAPYANDPFITPQAAIAPQTTADQRSAEPDPFNQITVDELGGFLASLYQCAYQDSGALLETFPDQITPRECRHVLRAMSDNKIDALFESGVPEDTRIAHKHGWISDTHGDAGIVFTPGGDFALVTVVHNPEWMDANESFPLMAEVSRAAWNYFNPDAQVEEIRFGVGVEECFLLGNPLIQELQSSTFDG